MARNAQATFAFVFGARILLGVSDKANALAEVTHEVEMFLPGGVDEFEQNGAFRLAELRSEDLVDTLKDFGTNFFNGQVTNGHGIQLESEVMIDVVEQAGGLGFGESGSRSAFTENFCKFGLDNGCGRTAGKEFAAGLQEQFANGKGLQIGDGGRIEIRAEASIGPACETFPIGTFVLLAVACEEVMHADGDGKGGFLFVVLLSHAFPQHFGNGRLVETLKFFGLNRDLEIEANPAGKGFMGEERIEEVIELREISATEGISNFFDQESWDFVTIA
jgi:hypothetical protein